MPKKKVNPIKLIKKNKDIDDQLEEMNEKLDDYDFSDEDESDISEENSDEESDEELYQFLKKAFSNIGHISRGDGDCVFDLDLFEDEPDEYEEDVPEGYEFPLHNDGKTPVIWETEYIFPFIDALRDAQPSLEIDECTICVNGTMTINCEDY